MNQFNPVEPLNLGYKEAKRDVFKKDLTNHSFGLLRAAAPYAWRTRIKLRLHFFLKAKGGHL